MKKVIIKKAIHQYILSLSQKSTDILKAHDTCCEVAFQEVYTRAHLYQGCGIRTPAVSAWLVMEVSAVRSRYTWELTPALPLLSSTMFMIICGCCFLQKIQETSRQREACGEHGIEKSMVQLKKFELAGTETTRVVQVVLDKWAGPLRP